MIRLAFERAAPVFYTDCCPSTNTGLKELAKAGAEAGTVLIAGEQTGGRGRMGRSFSSPEGGVYISMLLKPRLSEKIPQFSALAAVAVRRTLLECCSICADIKWPNDLLLNGKKLCGILAESMIKGDELFVVLGIGINLNTPAESFPPELHGLACSLYSLSGKKYDRDQFVRRLIYRLDELCSCWEKGESVAEEYRRACINPGREVTLIRGDEHINARALDITEDMELKVLLPDGREEKVNFGEVSLR